MKKYTQGHTLCLFILMFIIITGLFANIIDLRGKKKSILKECKQLHDELNLVTEELSDHKNLLITTAADKDASKRLSIIKYITARNSSVPDELANTMANNIFELCSKHKLPIPLIVGMVEIESLFNPFAVSNRNARGLLQVRYKIWAEELKMNDEKNLHNIHYGIEAGMLVLEHYLENSVNITQALQKYNGCQSNTNYSDKVFMAAGRFIIFQKFFNKRSD